MIAVIKQAPNGEIVGWMFGTNMHDLRRKAEGALQRDLAEMFYRMEFAPPPGKHEIASGVTMLVD